MLDRQPEYYVGYYTDVEIPAKAKVDMLGIIYGETHAYTAEFCRIAAVGKDYFLVDYDYARLKGDGFIRVPFDEVKPYREVRGKEYIS